MKKYRTFILFILLSNVINTFAQTTSSSTLTKKNILPIIESNLIIVKGGSFNYGPPQRNNIIDSYDRHTATLSSFKMSKYEITQEEFLTIMGYSYNPYRNNSKNYKGNKYPAYVNIEECLIFIEKLNEISHEKFRLPTVEEWEFAARGGTLSKGFIYSGDNNPENVGWIYHNTGNSLVHNVGMKEANELGLYDMTGNENEWCTDLKDNQTFQMRGGCVGSVRNFEVWEPSPLYKTYDKNIKAGFRIVKESDCSENRDSLKKRISIKGLKAPLYIREEFANPNTSKERLKQIAYMGYVDIMKIYCFSHLHKYYGIYWDCGIKEINNKVVEDVLPLIEAGIDNYADFQFMYACILSGSKTMINCYYNKINTPNNYKYEDLKKARTYFEKYLANPNRTIQVPFFQEEEILERMINNVFPDLTK